MGAHQGIQRFQHEAHHIAHHEDPEQLGIAQAKGKGPLLARGQPGLIGGPGVLVALAQGLPRAAAQHAHVLAQLLQLFIVLEHLQVGERHGEPAPQPVVLDILLVLGLQAGSLPLPVLLQGALACQALSVQRNGAFREVLPQLIRALPQLACDVFQIPQFAVQAHNGHHRHQQVRHQQPSQHCQQHPAQRPGDVGKQPHKARHDVPDGHRPRQSPYHAELQADVAVQVVGPVRVIPPFLVEKLFQQKARQVFQRRAQQHGAHQLNGQAVPKGAQQGVDEHHAQAVNGAKRPVQKSPVDKALLPDGREDHFAAPA